MARMTGRGPGDRGRRRGGRYLTLALLIVVAGLAVVTLVSRSFPTLLASQRAVPDLHKYAAKDLKPGNIACQNCHKNLQPQPGDAPVKDSTRSACLGCHEEKRALLNVEGKHTPFVEGECTVCHRAHPAGDRVLMKGSLGELCASCHPETKKEQGLPVPHRPFSDEYCASCHNPHASALKGLLRMPQKELCIGCHQKTVMAAQSKSDLHPPFAANDCTGCHNAHASRTPGVLKAPMGQLCFGCHSKESMGFLGHWNHRPFEIGDCGSCHELHSSDFDNLLRVQGALVCLSCHKKQA